MRTFINYATAWLAALLTLFLLAQFFIKRLKNSKSRHKIFFADLYKKTIKPHKAAGILVIFLGLAHGISSSAKIFSLNFGSLLLILYILLACSYFLRSRLIKWRAIHKALSLMTIAVFALHIYEVGGIRILRRAAGPPGGIYEFSLKNRPDGSGFQAVFADGVYIGIADGYGKDLTVEIQIKNNILTGIKVISHNEEDEKFYLPAFGNIPERILDSQSLDIDAVSGSTFTSRGIINAVGDALSKAVIAGEVPDITSQRR